MTEPVFHTPAAAAARLGMNEGWLGDQARAKKIPHHKVGRFVRFTDDDMDAIVASTAVAPAAEDPNAPTSRSQARRRSA